MSPEEALKIFLEGPQAVIDKICELDKTVRRQADKIETLENKIAKLSKNSSNSSKRPSSDDIVKPKPSGKKKGGKKRKIGAQPGHPRHERPLFAPDEIDVLTPLFYASCPDCDGEVFPTGGAPRTIQQIELPEAPVIKFEHRSYPVRCEKCGGIHYMPFDDNIVKEGLFKERLTALVAYMKYVCHVSFSTLRKFVRDVLGVKVSRGYLSKLIEKVGMALDTPYNELLDRLPLEKILNIDETGHKENKERFWTWVFKAELYVLFKIDKSRGSQVLVDVLGKEFDGVLGCDYFSAYRKFMKDFDITIQFCIAHLIRNIKFLKTLPDEDTRRYGEKLLEKVRSLFKVIHGREEMSGEDFSDALAEAKKEILETALQDVPSRIDENGKEKNREAQNMAKRFRDHGEAYFEFVTTPGVDPTNNVAERAIRFIVIDRHVTQGTRSPKGRKAGERLWTVIATCALQGRSAFNFILLAVSAFFNDRPAPSLIPDTS